MNRNQIIDLLSIITAYDKRTVGDADVAAWHAACKDLDFGEACKAVVEWFKNPANQVGWFTPGALRGCISTYGGGDIHAAAAARKRAIDTCTDCDDHGWINGSRIVDPDGANWEASDSVVRCRHDGRPLPEGFTPATARLF